MVKDCKYQNYSNFSFIILNNIFNSYVLSCIYFKDCILDRSYLRSFSLPVLIFLVSVY